MKIVALLSSLLSWTPWSSPFLSISFSYSLFLCYNQTRLDECLREQADSKQAREEAEREKEREEERSKRAKEEWEREREGMNEEISELRDNLRRSCDRMEKVEGKQKV